MSNNIDSTELVSLLVFAGVIWAGVAFLTPDDWRVHYAAREVVWPGDVFVDHKPKDCDFFHAPLGDKDCSYKATVQNLTLRRTKGGAALEASWDDGKSWSAQPWVPVDESTPSRPGNYVYVFWTKKSGS